MDNIQELVYGLIDKNNEYAYQCLKQLQSESMNSDIIYSYFDSFTAMLDDSNSYIRTRGILLIAANTQWDKACKVNEIIDKLLEHIMDEKPITARQCIQVLPIIVKYKPDLKGYIVSALHNAKPQKYKGSMQKLVLNDIQKSLEMINGIGKSFK
mgnify:CR=1 FL=1